MTIDKDSEEAVRLLSKQMVAEALDVSPWTIDSYVRRGILPPPIQLCPGAPKKWALKTIRDFIAKRRRSRWQKPLPRGFVRQAQEAGLSVAEHTAELERRKAQRETRKAKKRGRK